MILLWILLLFAGPERENHRGILAWKRQDTAKAIEYFGKAARMDSTVSDYAFNAGTLKALQGADSDSDFAAAWKAAKSSEEKARILYNRGTARLAKASTSAPGQGNLKGAIEDLRNAVRLRPGWQDASRNLESALRLRPPPQPQKNDPDPKQDQKQDQDQDKKQDPKQDPQKKPGEGDPKDGEKKDPKQDSTRKSPSEASRQENDDSKPEPKGLQPGQMDPRDAKRLLDGAAAREGQQQKASKRDRNETDDAPDW